MSPEDRPRFAAMLTTLAEVYNEPLSAFRLEAYFRALKGFGVEDLEAAADQAMQTSKFFPRPADFLECMGELPEQKALQDWHEWFAGQERRQTRWWEQATYRGIESARRSHLADATLRFRQGRHDELLNSERVLPARTLPKLSA